jgi:hypothetical protein
MRCVTSYEKCMDRVNNKREENLGIVALIGLLSIAPERGTCYQYWLPSTVNANRSKTYFPAVIGRYFPGFSSLTQPGSVSTVSS